MSTGQSNRSAALANVRELAMVARPIDEADYASERQVAAQNAFARAINRLLTPAQQKRLWEHDCYKADTNEIIDHALRAVGARPLSPRKPVATPEPT